MPDDTPSEGQSSFVAAKHHVLSTTVWLARLGLARYATNFQSHSTVADLAGSVFPEGTDIAAAEKILRERYGVGAAGPRSKLVSALRQWAPALLFRQSSPTRTINKLKVEPEGADELQLQTSSVTLPKLPQQTKKRGQSSVQTLISLTTNKRARSFRSEKDSGVSSENNAPNSDDIITVDVTTKEENAQKPLWPIFKPGYVAPGPSRPKFNRRKFSPSSDKPKPRKVHADCNRVPGTGFVVNSFEVPRDVNDATQHFLTHALSVKRFEKDFLPDGSKVLCSTTTAALAEIMYGLEPEQLRILPMGEPVDIPCTSGPGRGATVWQYDANQCAGGVMLLFRVWTSNEWVLHCGEFRFDVDRFMGHTELSRVVKERLLGSVYLDARYSYEKYDFPKRAQVLEELSRAVAMENERSGGRALFFCGFWNLAKEPMLDAVVKVLGKDVLVYADSRIRGMLNASNLDPELINRITGDATKARVFVVQMWKLFPKYLPHLIEQNGTINKPSDRGLAVCIDSIRSYKPGMKPVRRLHRTKDNAIVLKVGYFDYCSLIELKQFVTWARPKRIIPTVRLKRKEQREELFKLLGHTQVEQ